MRLQSCCLALLFLDLALLPQLPSALVVQERDRPSGSDSGSEDISLEDRKPTHVVLDELVPRSLARDWSRRNCLRARREDPGDDVEDRRADVEEWGETLPGSIDWTSNQTQKMMNIQNNSGWKELDPIPYQKRLPKLAVLMFVSNRVNNERVWVDWIKRAKNENLPLTVLIHRQSFTERFESDRMSEYIVQSSLGGDWCNMWSAQMLMMRRALWDEDVSHMFMVSRDSIPVKPLSYIYKALEKDPATRMCADDSWRGWGGTPRAESWWLMRREDAQLFEENSIIARRWFTSEGCVDEQAWYYPLRMREEAWGPEYAVRDECSMFADWEDGPNPCKDWRRTVELCKGCSLLRKGPHLPASSAHPASFVNVSAEAVQGLLESPFWFARKFEDGAIQTDAATLLKHWAEGEE